MRKMPWLPALPLLVAGCSSDMPDFPDTVPVSGRVTQADQPVEGANVTFHPPETDDVAHAASAVTGPGGEYVLRTFFSAAANEEGAVPGIYKVTVTKAPPVSPAAAAHGDDVVRREVRTTGPTNLLPKKYAEPTTTPFEVNVGAGKEEGYDLTIE